MSGNVYYLYKESGDTSFEAIRKLQKDLGLRKVGHCGTLDKFAQGLLIVLSDGATKLAGAITGLDKTYIAEIEFGRETDTLDPGGRTLREADVPGETRILTELDSWCSELRLSHGLIWQRPPAFSAIHSNGVRLYQKALAGEDLSQIPARQVQLYSCRFIAWQTPVLKVALHCSKGFYVRSFARDLALRCSSAGHLQSLLRTSIGSISVRDAQTLSTGVAARSIVSLLDELDGQLPIRILRTGRDLYANGEIVAEDWQLLRHGRIPSEVFSAAHKYSGTQTRDAESDDCYQFALIHRGQILGLFRYQMQRQENESCKPILKFWHNFC